MKITPPISEALQRKIDYAIRLIKSTVKDATVELCYSGGKDSDVILQLAKESGVSFRPIYRNTTIDPPGTIAHCKRNGVEILHPKTTFFRLIEHNGWPTRRCRFCCRKMKEYKVLDMSIQGIRRCESVGRRVRYSEDDPVICRIYGSKKNHVNVILPILSWTDEDVETFIANRGIQCHPLYYDADGRFHVERRLGCMGCPLHSDNGLADFRANPKLFREWCKRVKKWWDIHPHVKSRTKFHTFAGMVAHNIFYHSFGPWERKDLEDDGSETFKQTGHRDWLAVLETEIGCDLHDIF